MMGVKVGIGGSCMQRNSKFKMEMDTNRISKLSDPSGTDVLGFLSGREKR